MLGVRLTRPAMPTAANLFNTIACLQEQEGVRLQVVA